jgi:hypothetical protein
MVDSNYPPCTKNKKVLKRFFHVIQRIVDSELDNPFVRRMRRKATVSTVLFVILCGLMVSLAVPGVTANPGVHINVPHSPLAPNQPVYIEFYTDVGEDGTIQLDITKPPLLAIFWQSGPINITGGLLYDVTAPGFSDPGTYTVSAMVTLGGGPIYGSTTFEVTGGGPGGPGPGGGPGFDFHLEVEPPVTEIERGDAVHFQVHVVYSDPSYSGTPVQYHVEGLGPGMQWHPGSMGEFSISTSPETPPGTYHLNIIGEAQGVVRQTTATIIVREGPEEHHEEHPPEEHPPEEHRPEEPPEEHRPEEPPEEHHEEPPEEHHEEPPEEHRPEYQPYEPEPGRYEREYHEESGLGALLSNPLYLIVFALVIIIILLVVALMRK